MNYLKIYKIILFILIFMWMSVVYMLSNQTSDESSNLSVGVTEKVSSNDKNNEILEAVIRKIAHLSEYACGGILFALFFKAYFKDELKIMLLSEMSCLLYAISDEIHQFFVEGRAAQFLDVIIDGIGAGLGICVIILILKILKIKKI